MPEKVWTAEELERMSPAERRELFESSIVTDLAQVPEAFLSRVRDRAEKLIEDTKSNPR